MNDKNPHQEACERFATIVKWAVAIALFCIACATPIAFCVAYYLLPESWQKEGIAIGLNISGFLTIILCCSLAFVLLFYYTSDK